MLSDKFTNLVENQADRLEQRWAQMIKEHPATASYHKVDDRELEDNIREVYRNLGMYMDNEHDAEVLSEFLTEIGARRRSQGIPLSELVFAIILARRNLWDFIMEQGFFTSALEWHQVSEFWQRVANFFDKNIYFVILGYEEGSLPHKPSKSTVSKLIHSFSMGIFPEVDREKIAER